MRVTRNTLTSTAQAKRQWWMATLTPATLQGTAGESMRVLRSALTSTA